MKDHVYVAGPMRNRPLFNFPAFDAAEFWLRAGGFKPINPAEHDRRVLGLNENDFPTGCFERDQGWSRSKIREFMRAALAWDLGQICLVADTIALLPGWESSKGTTVELAAARAVGLHEIYIPETVLSEH